ncbi:MAG: cytochrome c1 [Cocleimonas sp.]|nr:cytochrome c1 [Cocleimonas sp.]
MSNSIRKWIFVLIVPLVVIGVIGSAGGSAGHGVALQSANVNLSDKASLQRGAKYYANYCMGCHSLKFSRYNRMAEDIGLNASNGFTDDQVTTFLKENLIFTRDENGKQVKTGSLMTTAYSAKAAEKAFGTSVPDLSLVGRSRGSDWIYSYLKSFYLDDSRPMGVNNTVFKDVGMPHVLAGLQGYQTLVHHEDKDGHHVAPTLTMSKPGTLSAAEYDVVVHDLTNFLAYVSEPAQLSRKMYGILTLLFLLVFFGFAYALSKEYWKDIH